MTIRATALATREPGIGTPQFPTRAGGACKIPEERDQNRAADHGDRITQKNCAEALGQPHGVETSAPCSVAGVGMASSNL
jgi:hypothetical protein